MKVCPYSPDEMKAAALEVANRFRVILGLPTVAELTPGNPGNFYTCAIGATIGSGHEVLNHSDGKVSIKWGAASHNDYEYTIESNAAWWFVQQFDAKAFPELIAS